MRTFREEYLPVDYGQTRRQARPSTALDLPAPQTLLPGTRYWKFGPTAGLPIPHWYLIPATISGRTATFTIVDGGLGDDDLAVNGRIVDQGGPSADDVAAVDGASAIPALSPPMLALTALLVAALALALRRRRAVLRDSTRSLR